MAVLVVMDIAGMAVIVASLVMTVTVAMMVLVRNFRATVVTLSGPVVVMGMLVARRVMMLVCMAGLVPRQLEVACVSRDQAPRCKEQRYSDRDRQQPSPGLQCRWNHTTGCTPSDAFVSVP